MGHLSNACSGEKPDKPQPSTSKETKEAGTGPHISKGTRVWTKIVKGGKSATPTHQQDVSNETKKPLPKKAARTKQSTANCTPAEATNRTEMSAGAGGAATKGPSTRAATKSRGAN